MAGRLAGRVKYKTAKYLCPPLHSNLHLSIFFSSVQKLHYKFGESSEFQGQLLSLNQHFSHLGNRFRTEIEKASLPIPSILITSSALPPAISIYTRACRKLTAHCSFQTSSPDCYRSHCGLSLWREIPKWLQLHILCYIYYYLNKVMRMRWFAPIVFFFAQAEIIFPRLERPALGQCYTSSGDSNKLPASSPDPTA